MYKLYGCAGTGSAGPQAILAEVGVEHEMILFDLDNEEHRSAENLAMNPRGQVPWLLTDEGVLTESTAIMMHLCDCHPASGMIGATGSINRANTYKWMSFLATNIYESVLRSEYASRYTTGSDADEVKAAAHRDIDRWWPILDEALHQTDGVDVWYARLMEAGADVEGERMFLLNSTFTRVSCAIPTVIE